MGVAPIVLLVTEISSLLPLSACILAQSQNDEKIFQDITFHVIMIELRQDVGSPFFESKLTNNITLKMVNVFICGTLSSKGL